MLLKSYYLCFLVATVLSSSSAQGFAGIGNFGAGQSVGYDSSVGNVGSVGSHTGYRGQNSQGGATYGGTNADIANFYGVQGQNKQTDLQQHGAYNGDSGAQTHSQGGNRYFGDLSALNGNLQNSQGYLGTNNFNNGGQNLHNVDSNGGHRQDGRTQNNGNFHHNDVASKSSSFFDDADDEDDHFNYYGLHNLFGNLGNGAFGSGLRNGNVFSNAYGLNGRFDNGYLAGGNRGSTGGYRHQGTINGANVNGNHRAANGGLHSDSIFGQGGSSDQNGGFGVSFGSKEGGQAENNNHHGTTAYGGLSSGGGVGY